MIVKGKSMLPTMESGSFVITKKMPSYQVDDIVSFIQREENAKIVIVHRIIEETDKGFVIKGDNNSQKDVGYYTNDDIKGKIIFSTPYVGALLGFVGNPLIMLFTFATTIGIQFEQKRRKKKREKLRRIHLGITKKDDFDMKDRPKKPDYTAFVGAIAFNVLIYVFTNFAINLGSRPQGDMITGFFYRIFEPSFASTIIFALYFIFIFALYFVAKVYERRIITKNRNISKRKINTVLLVLRKNFNPVLTVAQFLWLLYIIMSVFHMMTIGKEVLDILACDPTTALC